MEVSKKKLFFTDNKESNVLFCEVSRMSFYCHKHCNLKGCLCVCGENPSSICRLSAAHSAQLHDIEWIILKDDVCSNCWLPVIKFFSEDLNKCKVVAYTYVVVVFSWWLDCAWLLWIFPVVHVHKARSYNPILFLRNRNLIFYFLLLIFLKLSFLVVFDPLKASETLICPIKKVTLKVSCDLSKNGFANYLWKLMCWPPHVHTLGAVIFWYSVYCLDL